LSALEPWVVDASVVIARLLGEERPSWVDRTIEDVREGRALLLAPSLIWLELGNRLARATEIGDEFALDAMLQAEVLRIEEVPQSRPLQLRALTLARAHHLSMHEAMYLAAAEATRCRLLTLDGRLDHAATSMGLGREDGPAQVSEPAEGYAGHPVDTLSMAYIGRALAEMRREYSLD
jgi:predicted nucleic acid-binding protein